MSDVVQLIGNWPGAVLLRRSSLAYILANAGHILGIALLLGPILLLDTRLMGAFRAVPLAVVAPYLSGAAKLGTGLAIVTGFALFSVRPQDYVGNPAFLTKLVLLTLAITNALLLDRSQAWRAVTAGAEPTLRVRFQAAASLLLWLSVLIAGRWIGFT